MTPTDLAQLEALMLTGALEWLEPENVDRLLELAREKNRSPFELVVVALRRSFDREGTTPEEIEEAKQIFREAGLDWDIE